MHKVLRIKQFAFRGIENFDANGFVIFVITVRRVVGYNKISIWRSHFESFLVTGLFFTGAIWILQDFRGPWADHRRTMGWTMGGLFKAIAIVFRAVRWRIGR